MKTFCKWILIALLLAAIAAFAFWKSSTSPKDKFMSHATEVRIAGKILYVTKADTPEAQERGLSGRESLKEDEGMLFVFNVAGRHQFWMKDMNFPIDMIWIGKDFRVIHIEKDVTPETYPKTFGPEKDAKYVLETVSGFSEENNLEEGDLMEFLP